MNYKDFIDDIINTYLPKKILTIKGCNVLGG